MQDSITVRNVVFFVTANTDPCIDKVRDGASVIRKEHGGKWNAHPLFPTYAFFEIAGYEERDPDTLSMYNLHEVNAVGYLVSIM